MTTSQSEESRVREEWAHAYANPKPLSDRARDFENGWRVALKHSPTVLLLVEALKKYRDTPASYKYSSSLVRCELEAALSAYEEAVK